MLRAILTAIRDAGRPMCLADLSRDLGLEESALEGMLETLIARGRLRAIVFEDAGCTACPIQSGCFIMNDGVAKTYALLPSATSALARRTLPDRALPDGAQATPHMAVDVASLGADFYVLSGHKMFGPTGIGALYGKLEHLNTMPPYQGGGEMIRTVTFEKTEYAEPPSKFEAGTPNIAGAIGLGAAVDFLKQLDLHKIAAYEQELLDYGTKTLEAIDGVTLIGTAQHKAGVLSFLLEGVHAHDIGTILDREGIALMHGRVSILSISAESATQSDLDYLKVHRHRSPGLFPSRIQSHGHHLIGTRRQAFAQLYSPAAIVAHPNLGRGQRAERVRPRYEFQA